MDISVYFRVLRRWIWLIVLAALIGGTVSYAGTRTQPARYQASAIVQVGGYINLANPNADMISNSAALAQTYIALLRTRPVLEGVAQKLKANLSPDVLSGLFQVHLMSGTSLLEVIVTYGDPVVTADVANALVAQLIASSPTNLSKDQQEQLTILQGEIRQANTQLQSSRQELQTVESNLKNVVGQDLAILTERRTELLGTINATQNNLALMTSTTTTLQQSNNINSLRVVESANVPTSPIAELFTSGTLLATFVSALLACVTAFLIEYLNDTLRLPSEVMPLLNVPLLGAIAPFGTKRSYKNKLITWLQPRSTIAEAYRALRVNILFRETQHEESVEHTRFLAVTSSNPSEGKSITTANLAVTFAITGMRVLLIDADLRRPSQHHLFELPNLVGLSSLARTGSKTATPWAEVIQKTDIPNLSLVSSGPIPDNPAELLNAPEVRDAIRGLEQSGEYDMVLIDTPPTLAVADSSIIAKMAKAQLIVVIKSGRTRRGAALRTVQQLSSLSLPVLGVVINRLKRRDQDAGYGYYYYYYGSPASLPPDGLRDPSRLPLNSGTRR